MDCGVFSVQVIVLKRAMRRWRKRSSTAAQLGYRPLSSPDSDFYVGEWTDSGRAKNAVKVVVGKERRVFEVDPRVLEEDAFQILLEMTRQERKKSDEKNEICEKIFVDCDAILFEHMLWLLYNDCSSLLQLNLEEIIEFYAQDST